VDGDEVAVAGMAALAAVARGSHEPQLIVLRQERLDTATALVAAVGKGMPSTRAAVAEAEGVADGGEVGQSAGGAVLAAVGAIAELGLRPGWSACRGPPRT
jgi:hypothetical protein